MNITASLDDCIDEVLIHISFDPQDQARLYVNVNAQAALLWGFTKVEYLRRFVNSELVTNELSKFFLLRNPRINCVGFEFFPKLSQAKELIQGSSTAGT